MSCLQLELSKFTGSDQIFNNGPTEKLNLKCNTFEDEKEKVETLYEKGRASQSVRREHNRSFLTVVRLFDRSVVIISSKLQVTS